MPYAREEDIDAGDLVWVDFGPPLGREPAGRRPALVISPRIYNERSARILVCPITRNRDVWAFKVELQGETHPIQGAILVDQVRSIDRVARFTRRVGRAGTKTLGQVHGMLATLLGIPVSN